MTGPDVPGADPDVPDPDAAGAGLVVRDLRVGYTVDGRSRPALRGLDLRVAPGESFALVGESGCGKSTVAYALGRHLARNGTIEAGSVLLDGIDILALGPEALRRWRADRFALVHQEPASALDPTMRLGAQVAEVVALHGADRRAAADRAVELLERVALPDPARIARRYPHQVSGGQQQRVVIAMALAASPWLLVLDEPTTGLDATVEAGVLDLLDDQRRGLDAATVFITHNLGLVRRRADRIGVLYAGRLVEEGTVDDVLADPLHPYTAGLLRAVPRPDRSKTDRPLVPIPGAPPPPGATPAGCAFAARCPLAGERCRTDDPALVEHRPGRRAACHHAGRPAWVDGGGDGVDTATPASAAVPVRHRAEPAPASDPAPVLRARGVAKRYGDVVALDGVDLDIASGEVVGLVGESGSGKTTLARIVAGLTAPDAGTVDLDGEPLDHPVERRSSRQRERVQMVFQSPETTLNPRHRVRRILDRAVDRLDGGRSTDELAALVHLDAELLDLRSTRLSGGQRQRVAIARALAGRPALLIGDEPVSALDVSVQAAVLRLLAELQRTAGVAQLFVSHDLAVVAYLADRVAVMQDGRIVEQGPTAEVLHEPRHPTTRSLLAAAARAS